jgi:hypothetical protein
MCAGGKWGWVESRRKRCGVGCEQGEEVGVGCVQGEEMGWGVQGEEVGVGCMQGGRGGWWGVCTGKGAADCIMHSNSLYGISFINNIRTYIINLEADRTSI